MQNEENTPDSMALISDAGRDSAGRFAAGNRIWASRKRAGLKPRYQNPDDLWTDCVAYFEWVHDNPLQEVKLVSYQGVSKQISVPKMRAMTLAGLWLHIGIAAETWNDWRKNRTDLSEVIARVEMVIYEYKFTGAAADLLNPNIIARDLGLADKSDVQHLGENGKPAEPPSDLETARRIAFILAKAERQLDGKA